MKKNIKEHASVVLESHSQKRKAKIGEEEFSHVLVE
jgi:hypothetical protein